MDNNSRRENLDAPDHQNGGPLGSLNPSAKWTTLAYIFTLALFGLGSFLHGTRAWGIDSWAYLPWYFSVGLLATGLLGPVCAIQLTRRMSDTLVEEPNKQATQQYALVSGCLVVLWTFVLYWLKAQTHFLGDGYQLLGNLTRDQSYIKWTEFGSEIVVRWVSGLVAGTGAPDALAAYRLVSIASGTIFVTACAVFAGLITTGLRDRILLLLALCAGGYMLLFFGYVENYSLLCLLIGVFLMVGVLVTRSRLSRLWILPPLGMAAFFHVVGLTLVPAALYILVHNSRLAMRLTKTSRNVRIFAIATVVTVALATFGYLYSTNLYFRLAFVPLIENRFSANGYTLMSLSHFIDFLNLCLIVFPGLLVALTMATSRGNRQILKATEFRFLIIATVSTLCAAFLLDPKLGMPRDWDVLSFFGLPLTMLACLLALRAKSSARSSLLVLTLIAIPGMSSLFSRVTIQHVPGLGTELAREYMTLDLKRNRWGFVLLQKYYETASDSARLDEIKKFRVAAFPDTRVVFQAKYLVDSGQVRLAKPMLEAVVAGDANFSDAWIGLATCYNELKLYDSALDAAQIADGLNPNNAVTLYNMGLAYRGLDKTMLAERVWLRSLALDSSFAALSLCHLYKDKGDSTKYWELLRAISARPTADLATLGEALEMLFGHRQFPQAALLLRRLQSMGIDTAYIESVRRAYPQLR